MAGTWTRAAPLLLLPPLCLLVAGYVPSPAGVDTGSTCRTRRGEAGRCMPLRLCRQEMWRLPTPCSRWSVCCPLPNLAAGFDGPSAAAPAPAPTAASSAPTAASSRYTPASSPYTPASSAPTAASSLYTPASSASTAGWSYGTSRAPPQPPPPPPQPPTTAPAPTTTTQRVGRATTQKVLTKSQQKCEEWGKAVFRIEESPLLLDDAPPVNRSLCGGEGTPYIIGGVPAEPTEFPHMAAVGFGPESSVQFLCGGALVSERWVLTAAHCLDDYTNSGVGPPRWVRLGDNQPEGSGEHRTAQDFKVKRRVWHPQYRYPLKDHDLGLIELDADAEFNEYVRPACLSWRLQPVEQRAIVTGWGKTEKAGYSESLLKVELPLTDQQQCVSVFQKLAETSKAYTRVLPNGIRDDMLCAGEPKGGKDSCQGDSGGPLQVRNAHPYCTYSILGVVSFGKGCAEPGYPAVYTRVASYVQWIEEVVWP